MFGLAILLAPLAVASVPIPSPISDDGEPIGWWTETTVDRNQNKIGDMVELHIDNPIFLDEDNTLPLIIDFYYTPGADEIDMLENTVDYQHQFVLHGIDALAGRVPVTELLTLIDLPGVVMIELDGILTIANADARAGHGVDMAFEETGYDGSGTTVAIIDTGLDGNHSSLDDQDDDPSTYDPKIIGFYDPVNNAGNTNGTDFPYDDGDMFILWDNTNNMVVGFQMVVSTDNSNLWYTLVGPESNAYGDAPSPISMTYFSGQQAITQEADIQSDSTLEDLVDLSAHNDDIIEDAIEESLADNSPEAGGPSASDNSGDGTTEAEDEGLLPFISPVLTIAMIAIAGIVASLRIRKD